MLAAIKFKMHDPLLTYNHISKDLLLQCMHEAAAEHGMPLNSLISLQCQKLIVLISLNNFGMVGIGLGASLEGEFGSKKEYF